MDRIILCNVFTTAMLDPNEAHTYRFVPASIEEAKGLLEDEDFVQAVGHPATCEVLSARLDLEIRPERANIKLDTGDLLIVAQVVVPRLAEGQVLSREQVESCPIQFWQVTGH